MKNQNQHGLDSLNSRHRELEQRIAAELRRPLPDTLKVQELKRLKLSLKERIVRLRSTQSEALAA